MIDDGLPWGYEVESSVSLSAETSLDVGHELAPDVLEAVDTQGGVLAGLAGDVSFAGVRSGEHGEHDVVLGSDSKISGQIRAGLTNIGGLQSEEM